MKADFIGFATAGGCCALLAWLVPDRYVPGRIWPFICVGVAVCAWLYWLHPKAPQSPGAWVKCIGWILVCGGILAAINAIPYGAAAKSRLAAVYVTVFAVIVAAAGLARSLAKGERNRA